MQEFWQRPVLPQLAAEIEYVMGMTMRRRMRKRGNIWMRKARMMMRKKRKIMMSMIKGVMMRARDFFVRRDLLKANIACQTIEPM